jgi:hypothetical protein
LITPDDRERLRVETSNAVEQVVADVLAAPEPSQRDMLLHVMAEPKRTSDGVSSQD